MSALTEAELLRLRLPALLPGLDATGLLVRYVPSAPPAVCLDHDEDGVRVESLGGGWRDATVDLVDRRTASAAAAWLAVRLGVGLECTGATWEYRGWWDLDAGYSARLSFGGGEPHFGATRWNRIPALRDLDSSDERRLPDGSRWVDRAALADVCRFAGAHAAGVRR